MRRRSFRVRTDEAGRNQRQPSVADHLLVFVVTLALTSAVTFVIGIVLMGLR
jgi:hypothetical protein